MASGPRYSDAARAVAAKAGQALPNGSYPIRNKRELMAAVRRRHQGKAPYGQIVAHIQKRAKDLGVKLHMTASAFQTDSEVVAFCYTQAKKKGKK